MKKYQKRISVSFQTQPLESTIHLLFILTVFSIPLPLKLNNIFIIALSISIIVFSIKRRKIKRLFDWEKRKKILIFGSLYLIQIIGLIYSDEFRESKQQLEVKSTILLFPVFFALYDHDFNLRRNILISFFISCNIVCLVSVYYHFSFYTENDFYYALSNIGYLVHTGIPKVRIHPVYFSGYLLFCTIIARQLYYLIPNRKIKIVLVADVLVLSFFIFLLASRIVLVVYAFFLFILLLKKLKNKTFLYQASLSLAIIMILAITVISLPVLNIKVKHLLNQINQPKSTEESIYVDGVSFRIQKWRGSALVLKENFFLGVGTGDATMALLDAYKKINFTEGIKQKFNAHNEYLQEFIRHGIIGFLILIVAYTYSFLLAIKRNDQIFLLFMVIIIFLSLTESILSLQKGVVFYAFFNSLFAFNKPESNLINLS